MVALNAAARIRSPAVVYRNVTASASVATSTATTTNTSNQDTPIGVPPTFSPMMENAAGNERYCPPKKMPARPSSKMSSPIVTITALSGGLPIVGRITDTSQAAPSIRPAASAITNPAQ